MIITPHIDCKQDPPLHTSPAYICFSKAINSKASENISYSSFFTLIGLCNPLSPMLHSPLRSVCLRQWWLSLYAKCGLSVGRSLEETKVVEGLFYAVITGSQAFNPQRSNNDIPSAFITWRSMEKRWLWTNEHSDLYAINMTRAV